MKSDKDIYTFARANGLYSKGLPYRLNYIKFLKRNYFLNLLYQVKKFVRITLQSQYTYSPNFKKIIGGKSICIIGPLKGTKGDGALIDSFDIVIRCNQRKKIFGKKAYKGTKTNIIYYNGQFGSDFLKSYNPCFLKKNVLYCFKFGGKKSLLSNKLSGISRFYSARITDGENNERFLGSPQLIPLIVNDLVRHNAEKIFIFHCDFLLTKKRSKGYFSKRFSKLNKQAAFLTNTGSHDAISSFNYLKKFYKQGRVSGDSRFVKAIQLSLQEYSRKLESKYRFVHRS